jgi:methionine transaminase
MPAIDSKLPRVGTTIFTIMSRLAEQHDAVNLSQGFPDFQPPEALIDLVREHLARGRNQYAPMAGAVELREAIAAQLQARYRVSRDPVAEITVTSGATEALFAAIAAVISPGDEAIVFDPAYDSYEPAITLAGGRTVHLPLHAPDFRIDFDRLASALNERTRLVIVNSPHNPTGTLIGRPALEQLAQLLRPLRCWLLSDEVYEHIVFDGVQHASVLTHPELAERSFVVSSFGKACHATGWKVGYSVAPPALTEELRKIHQYLTFSVVTPLQHALADHLRLHPEHYRNLSAFYQARRDEFAALLAGTRLKLLRSHGTYFQLADFSAISDRDDVDFARWLTAQHGVAVIPVSVFYQSPPDARLVRFCFAKTSGTLREAARRLAGL